MGRIELGVVGRAVAAEAWRRGPHAVGRASNVQKNTRDRCLCTYVRTRGAGLVAAQPDWQ